MKQGKMIAKKKGGKKKGEIGPARETGWLRSIVVRGEPTVESDFVCVMTANPVANNYNCTTITPANVITMFASTTFPKLWDTASGAIYGRYRPISFSIEMCPYVNNLGVGQGSAGGFYAIGPASLIPPAGATTDVLDIQHSLAYFPAAVTAATGVIGAKPYCSNKGRRCDPILTYKLSGTDEFWQGGASATTVTAFANVYYYGVLPATQTSYIFLRMRAQFQGLGESFT